MDLRRVLHQRLISILFCWLYRQPLAFFWTIPGTVLVGPALAHLSFAEVIGAYYATGVLMLVLGATGWVRRAMQAVPMPIVMGMVAGVFLRFGLDLVRSLHADIAIAGPMVAAWLLLTASAGAGAAHAAADRRAARRRDRDRAARPLRYRRRWARSSWCGPSCTRRPGRGRR